jgi:hypothetical protein
MQRTVILVLALGGVALSAFTAAERDPSRVLSAGQKPADSRLGKPKDLNGYFPMTVPDSMKAWGERRTKIHHQVLVANGLWPLPPKTPLTPVVHGRIDRDDYTIEKVFFASYPGHYVSGNLYRPKGRTGRLAGVLCPHGHWPNGRFYDAGEQGAKEQIKREAEKGMAGARYPLQARCVQLARMGCVVFHYDMVGYADSQQIPHSTGFTDAQAELRLQSFMGLQTWNSIRSLDFLLSLPEVDPHRIGVTGASGGGTQTFILGAVDERPAVAFPAVMVSTAMQGGCICENCSHLRVGIGNIDLAGLFAPKPLAMSGANDWTIDIETKGLPELKALFRLYGAEDRVLARCYRQFDHNYNQVSREMMYNWFNKYLKLGQPEPVVEKTFVPVLPKDLSVYDTEHPQPKEGVNAGRLRQHMTLVSDCQMEALRPTDTGKLKEFRRVVGKSLSVLVHDEWPPWHDIKADSIGPHEERKDGLSLARFLVSRKGQGEKVPVLLIHGPDWQGSILVWIHPQGKASLFREGKLIPEAQRILDRHLGIMAPDVFLTGELSGAAPMPINSSYAGYTFGYNRTLLANRIHDILLTVSLADSTRLVGKDPGSGVKKREYSVHLVGFEAAGPWVLLARALCLPQAVQRTAADANQFHFGKVKSTTDPMMLPGALKYGGLPAFTALAAPGELFVYNHEGTGLDHWAPEAYRAEGNPERLKLSLKKADRNEVIDWLLR